jgi:hypothetical protein
LHQDAPLPTIPLAGNVTVTLSSQSDGVFNVHCANLTASEQHALVGFFAQMGARLGAFRFQHGPVVYPSCCFDCDTLPHEIGNAGPYSLTFPIKVLRENSGV